MKTQFRSIFNGVIICLITLLVVYIFQPSFLIQKKHYDQVVVDDEVQNQNKVPVKKEYECDSACVDRVVANMISGDNLSYRNGLAIKRVEGEKAAVYLLNNPEKMFEIEQTLKRLDGQDDRDSILFVFSSLPAKQIMQIAERLLSSNDKIKNQSDGLSLLTHALQKGEKIDTQLTSIIKNTKDISIAIKAIKIMSETYPEQIEQASSERLNRLIANVDDEKNQSKALLIKVRLFESNNNIKNDIVNALNSESVVFRESGIRALDNVLNRQKKGIIKGGWKSDSQLKATIENIANNTNEKPRARIEALNLIRRHF